MLRPIATLFRRLAAWWNDVWWIPAPGDRDDRRRTPVVGAGWVDAKSDKGLLRWAEGTVDRRQEHMVLTYGNSEKQDPKDWVRVALVAAPRDGLYTVQFLVSRWNWSWLWMRREVIWDLDFYLVKKPEYDNWGYAKYHCGTAANWYGRVHWAYYPATDQGWPFGSRPENGMRWRRGRVQIDIQLSIHTRPPFERLLFATLRIRWPSSIRPAPGLTRGSPG